MSLQSLVALLIGAGMFDAGFVALMVLCSVMFPNVSARARHNAEAMPIRSFIVGLINFIFFALISVALLSAHESLRLGGLIIATMLFSLVAVGIAGVARLVGARVSPNESSATQQTAMGALVLALSVLVPLVGWFAVPLLVGLIGYGALIIALIWRRAPAS